MTNQSFISLSIVLKKSRRDAHATDPLGCGYTEANQLCNSTVPALPKALTHVVRPEVGVGGTMLEWKLKIDVTAFRVDKL